MSSAYASNRELLRDMRLQLLDLLSLAIAKRPFNPSTTQSKFQALSAALASGERGISRAVLEERPQASN